MKHILLIHHKEILHYRCAIYNVLYEYLEKNGFHLTVVAEGIQEECPYTVEFPFCRMRLTMMALLRLLRRRDIDAVIFFVRQKNPYLFPIIVACLVRGIKVIYWGHGCNLMKSDHWLTRIRFGFQHLLSHAVILYGEAQRKFVRPKARRKTFVAVNTLNTGVVLTGSIDKKSVLEKYNIRGNLNIIFVGRILKNKRLPDLVAAFRQLNRQDVGLVLVGPDPDGILDGVKGRNIVRIGEMYGAFAVELIKACDIFCLPGSVGLGIVDAFTCSLPFVTEDVIHSPEIMYLKEGINGFMVPEGDINALAERLELLLDDSHLRRRMGEAGKQTIETEGRIEDMCRGFLNALHYCFK